MYKSKGNTKFILTFAVIMVDAVGGIVNTILEDNRLRELGCKPTGEQKFRNWGDSIIVQDKLLCRDGHVEWADAN